MFSNNVSWDRFTKEVVDYLPPTDEIPYINIDLKIIPDWNISVFLEWETYVDGPDSPVEYMVYSSFSEAGPFTRVTAQPITDTQYFTRFALQDSKVFEQYFTIEFLYENGEKYRSYPMTAANRLPTFHMLRHRDIIRRERILLEKFVGVDTIVYVPKNEGLRCRTCWDPTFKRVMDDHCDECFGTSYEGGYNTGMRTMFQYSSIDPRHDSSYQGQVEPITISAWTVAFPLIPPHAILLRVPDRKVFRCEAHQGSTEILTNTQRQSVVAVELARSRVEHRLFDKTDAITIIPYPPHTHH